MKIKIYRNRRNIGFWIAKQEDLGIPGMGKSFMCDGKGLVVCLWYLAIVIGG